MGTMKTIDSPRTQDTSRSLKIMHCPGSDVHYHAETVATHDVVKELAAPCPKPMQQVSNNCAPAPRSGEVDELQGRRGSLVMPDVLRSSNSSLTTNRATSEVIVGTHLQLWRRPVEHPKRKQREENIIRETRLLEPP